MWGKKRIQFIKSSWVLWINIEEVRSKSHQELAKNHHKQQKWQKHKRISQEPKKKSSRNNLLNQKELMQMEVPYLWHMIISMTSGLGLRTMGSGISLPITSIGISKISRRWSLQTRSNKCSLRESKRSKKRASVRHQTLLPTVFRLESRCFLLLQDKEITLASWWPLAQVMEQRRNLGSLRNVRSFSTYRQSLTPLSKKRKIRLLTNTHLVDLHN